MTTETSSIDEKKNEPASKTDIKGFLKSYGSSIIFSIIFNIFILGTIGLYTTKVAQANILPDNVDLAPYTVVDRIIAAVPIDINIMKPSLRSDNKEIFSQKAIFESQKYLDSFSNSFLCTLKKYAELNENGTANSNIALYLSHVYDNLIAIIFSIINKIFFSMSYLNESAFMFLYGLFYSFIWTIIFFISLFFSFVSHVANIPQLFRYVAEQPNIGKNPNPSLKILTRPKWESENDISIFRPLKIILFLFIYLPIIFCSIFASAFGFTIYGFFAPLYATYKIKDDKTNKTEGILDFIKNTFKYKKLFFIVLASVSLFLNGINYFGSASVISVLVAILAAWFFGLYTNTMPEVGQNGFTLGIQGSPVKAELKKNLNTYLVNICTVIPMVDGTMEQIIKKAKKENIREIKVGGDKSVTFNPNVEFAPSETNLKPFKTNLEPSETLKPYETLEAPSKSLKPSETNLKPSETNLKPSKTLESLEPPSETLESLEPSSETNSPPMSGGTKNKKNYKKKYNIKFT